MNGRRQRSSRDGFSLIEAAIVLGVVGLVIGGLWIAASSVQKTRQLNGLVTGVSQYFQKANEFWLQTNQDAASLADISYLGAVAGMFPPDWVRPANYIVAPGTQGVFNGGSGVEVVANQVKSSLRLRIIFANNPQLCIRFVTEFTRLHWKKISYLDVGASMTTSFAPLAEPLSPGNAALVSECSHATSNVYISYLMGL